MTKQTIPIDTPFIRLDTLLKYARVSETGGQAKWLVQEGNVLLNGTVCLQRGKKIYPGDVVTIPAQGMELTVQ